ncbi:MAG: 16S rRNA (guanine(527)-N(7))-methyltransferase RsmG [Clostridia bacterium]|nr:16S rRNA (guanine(527)-N(7))-methyltransferase RsmG [Clostridia bacterium]
MIDALKKLNINDAETKADLLMQYMDCILEKNESVNLTAITDREEFVQKHFLDSLSCVEAEEFLEADRIIDVGTGGGFPGIPLAVCFPEKKFVLMDSLAKRINIIRELCVKLGIENVSVVHGRAEDLGRQEGLREAFDLCVSRAVANMSTLCEYCLPFVRKGGWFIAYKGPDCKSEIDDALGAIRVLGGRLDRIDASDFRVKEGYNHRLVFVNKAENTPEKYPRKAGTPSKKPL